MNNAEQNIVNEMQVSVNNILYFQIIADNYDLQIDKVNEDVIFKVVIMIQVETKLQILIVAKGCPHTWIDNKKYNPEC